MTTDPRLAFTVPGRPRPAGSKRAFAIRQAGAPTGRIAVTDANPRSRDFKHTVAAAAAVVMGDRGRLLTGPLALEVTFMLARPIGHYGTGTNRHRLRPSAPAYPAVRPDCTKLLRGVEDALTGVIWRDDAQIVEQVVRKVYSEPERTEITVRTVST